MGLVTNGVARSNLMGFHAVMITARQIRAGRSLVGWSQAELADRAVLSRNSIQTIEAGKANPTSASLAAIKAALEAGGVEFLPASGGKGEGVRLARIAS